MLVHKFASPPRYSTEEILSAAKKVYSTKLKMVLLQKLKDLISTLSHLKKQLCGASHA